MKRKITQQLIQWKNSPSRNPLILNGARQVGKTFILREFGREHYKNTVYVNLESNGIVGSMFNDDISPSKLIKYLEAEKGNFKTDGSIYNTPYVPGLGVNRASPWLTTRFLKQDTIEYTWQLKLGAEYRFPKTKAGEFTLGAEYMFEFIKNYGVGRDLFPGQGTESLTTKDVENAINLWKSNLKDVKNHYLRITNMI